jgi:CheY-like chemotaxis protein
MLNPEPEPGHLDATPAPQPGLKIVVVDDDSDFRELLEALIQDAFPEARILTFANGITVWEYLEEASPDLLISDLRHCGMDGLEMLSRLCQKDVLYPIVILSGTMPALEPEARRAAGPRLKVHCLPKPLFPNQFIFLLKQCLALPLLEAGLRKWSTGRPQPLRIVQLDDEEPILNIVAIMLRQCFPNLLLYQFQQSPSAWRILTEARPDLLITDDIMHGNREWNGESIVRCLVERGVDYPILVLSAWLPTQAWVQQVEAECDNVSFLAEPFAPVHFYRELGKFFGPLNLP